MLDPLERGLRENNIDFEILRTTEPMEARRLSREACESKSEGIIAIGGDGTLQEIALGMREAWPSEAVMPTPLAVLPCGSGNDFALTFGGTQTFGGDKHVYKKLEFNRVCSCVENIIKNKIIPIDLIRVTGEMVCKASSQTFNENACVNIANLGLDARIVHNAHAFKKRFGKHAYLAAAYKSISQHKNIKLELNADGDKRFGSYTLLAVCNGQYYGGGLRISPSAQLDDGKITLCEIDEMNRLMAMALFPTVIFEKHTKIKKVGYSLCERLTVSVGDGEVLCLDGNLYDVAGDLQFELMKGALRMFAP